MASCSGNLWLRGEAFVTQFLRLRMVSGMMSGEAKISTQQLRAQLDSGATVEIAGYDLAPQLAHAIDCLSLVDLRPPPVPIYWLDIVEEATPGLCPATQRAVDTWLSHGIDVRARAVCGEPFWSTIEQVDSPQVFAETASMLGAVYA